MSTYVSDLIAKEAKYKGTFLGKTTPNRESKGTHWEVYYYDGKIIACVMDDSYCCCGELLPDYSHLRRYVANELEAIERLALCLV